MSPIEPLEGNARAKMESERQKLGGGTRRQPDQNVL